MSDVLELFGKTALDAQAPGWEAALDHQRCTDSKGIAACLGLQADANIELDQIIQRLETRISEQTLFTLGLPDPTTRSG